MFFASKRQNALETRLKSLEGELRAIREEWHSEQLALTELKEIAQRTLSRVAMRTKREMQAVEADREKEQSPSLPNIDETTMRIIARRSKYAVPSNGG